MNLSSAYGLVAFEIAETGVETYLAYGELIVNWGNFVGLDVASETVSVLTDMQPLFNAIRE